MSNVTKWNTKSLLAALVERGITAVAVGNAISVTAEEQGDLQITIVVTAQQTLMSTQICPVATVRSEKEVNAVLMRKQDIIPLTTVSITEYSDGEWFVASGQLSSGSLIESMVEELNTLAINAIELAEVFADQFIGE